MSSDALVSVVVPNYNHAPYIRQRIESILAQTYQDYELIILDDCSTDNSREIIEQYRNHPRVARIVYNGTNGGSVFRQWQKGIALAKGAYIWIAESDDYCEPGFLQTAVEHIRSGTDNVISYTQSLLIAENRVIERTEVPFMSAQLDARDWILHHMLGGCGLCNASMAVFRRKEALEVDWEQVIRFQLCGDWFFWVQLAAKGKVAISGKYLNYFRKYSGSSSAMSSVQGIYYAEGSQVFSWIVQHFQLSDAEIEAGLKRMVWHYYYNVGLIRDQDVMKNVWSYIEAIHPPLARHLLKQHQVATKREKIKRRIMNVINVFGGKGK